MNMRKYDVDPTTEAAIRTDERAKCLAELREVAVKVLHRDNPDWLMEGCIEQADAIVSALLGEEGGK